MDFRLSRGVKGGEQQPEREVVEPLKIGMGLRKIGTTIAEQIRGGHPSTITFSKTSSSAKMVKLSVWFLGTLVSRNPVGMSSGWRQGKVSSAGRRIRAELQTSSSHLLGVT